MVFYMDLVQHDMLNDNQAVLSYLELILATPGVPSKAADYARKAVSHVRSSALRMGNVSTITNAMKSSAASRGTTDLAETLRESSTELSSIFPGRNIRVSWPQQTGEASVVGGSLVKELVFTVMENIVRLDPGNDITLNVLLSEDLGYGNRGWTVTIEDPRVNLPAVVTDADIDEVHTKDRSLAVKVSGILFAKMATEALGGDFSVEPGSRGSGRGAVFTLRLRRAGR